LFVNKAYYELAIQPLYENIVMSAKKINSIKSFLLLTKWDCDQRFRYGEFVQKLHFSAGHIEYLEDSDSGDSSIMDGDLNNDDASKFTL
jgi:hypothetical protein